MMIYRVFVKALDGARVPAKHSERQPMCRIYTSFTKSLDYDRTEGLGSFLIPRGSRRIPCRPTSIE